MQTGVLNLLYRELPQIASVFRKALVGQFVVTYCIASLTINPPKITIDHFKTVFVRIGNYQKNVVLDVFVQY